MSTTYYYAGTLTLPNGATFAFTAQLNGTAAVTISESPNGPVLGKGNVSVGGGVVWLNPNGNPIYGVDMSNNGEQTTIQWAVQGGAVGVLASWPQP